MNKSVHTWATAISTSEVLDRRIVWRFVQDFHETFHPSAQPERIIIVWRYESENGQPKPDEYLQMNVLEDALEPIVETGAFATLAIVATGQGLREWTYYTQSADAFIKRLNTGLAGQPLFPIEIHVAPDPTWSMYAEFKAGVVGTAEPLD